MSNDALLATRDIGAADLSESIEKRRQAAYGALALPGLAFLGVFFLAPIGYLLVLSLHAGGSMGRVDDAWTIANYVRFLSDPYYLRILLDTLSFGALTALICAVCGFPFSYWLARTRSSWRTPMLFVTVLPLLISAVIRNLGWIPVLTEHGMLNSVLIHLEIIRLPLQLIFNYTGALIGMVHVEFPFMVLMLTSAICKIDPALEEAAINLGATPAQAFVRVVLPLCRPGLAAGASMVFMAAISALVTPGILGGHRVMFMALYIDQQMHNVLNYPVGSTAAILTMIAALASMLLALRVSGART